MNKRNITYLILLIDRKHASMITLLNGLVIDTETVTDGQVPQKVKHGDDTWDAQDKIFRHIEDHLHRHLTLMLDKATSFVKEHNVSTIIIGSHKPLFAKIEKNLPLPLAKKVKGYFVTELNAPFNEILERANLLIAQLERQDKKET